MSWDAQLLLSLVKRVFIWACKKIELFEKKGSFGQLGLTLSFLLIVLMDLDSYNLCFLFVCKRWLAKQVGEVWLEKGRRESRFF